MRRRGSLPYNLANVPPMFPLTGFSRTRRASAGGLPPPVPGYTHPTAAAATGRPATDRPAPSTWRSLSPSRPGTGRKNEWSISPVLRPLAGPHAGGALPSYVSPSGRRGGGSVDGSRRERRGVAALAPPPPHRVLPERERRPQAEASASVTRLGQAMGMPFPGSRTSPVRPRGRTPSSPRAAEDHSASTSSSGDYQQPLVSPSGSVCLEAVESTGGGTASSGGQPIAAQPTPPGTDGAGRPAFFSGPGVSEAVSVSGRDGNLASPPSSREPTAHQDSEGSSPGLPVPSATSTLPSNGVLPVAAEAETSQSCLSPPAMLPATDQQWVAGLSGATALVISDGQGGPSDEISRAGDDGSDVARPSPPPISSDFFGLDAAAGEIGVTAGPSPFVNTSSPLTRGRNGGLEPSMFGADGVDGDGKNGGSGDVSGAADLFAAEAPARAADELFCSYGPDEHKATSRPNGSASAADTSVFSQGPPPEVPVPRPSSLPNPWGCSPQRQPLTEPKRWPTKAGTGFDRPLTPLSTEQKIPGGGHAAGAASAEVGAIPSEFFGQEDTAEFKDSRKGVAGGVGRAAPASFMPPVVAAPTIGADVATAHGWEVGSNGSLDAASRCSVQAAATAVVAVKPASNLYARGGSFGGRSDHRSGDAGWGSGSATGTAVTSLVVRDPSIRPPGVFAVFGFGGKLICMHPKRKLRLAPVPGAATSGGDGPALRKGPVKVSERGLKIYINACPPKWKGGGRGVLLWVGLGVNACVSSVLFR